MRPIFPIIFQENIGHKVFDYALKLFFVLGTLFYLPVVMDNPDLALEKGYMHQELFFRYGVLLLFAISLFTTQLRGLSSGSSRILSIFLVYTIVISTVVSFDLQSRRAIMNIATGLLFIKVVVEHSNIELRDVGMWAYWLLFANLILCFCQILNVDPLYEHAFIVGEWRDAVGFMKLKASLGCLTALLAPLVFYVHPLCTLICLPLLYYSDSSTAVMAFVVSMSFLAYFKMNKKLWWGLMITGFLGGVTYVLLKDMPTGQFGSRFEVWGITFSHALKYSPFFGVGIGKFAAFQPLTSQGPNNPDMLAWIWAHNEYLQVFFELGAVALLLVLLYVRQKFKSFQTFKYSDRFRASFASFLVLLGLCVFHFPFHIAKLAIPSLFVMALMEIRISEQVKHNDNLTAVQYW